MLATIEDIAGNEHYVVTYRGPNETDNRRRLRSTGHDRPIP